MSWHPFGADRRWSRLPLRLPAEDVDAEPPKAEGATRFVVAGEAVDAVDESAAVMWSDHAWRAEP